MTRISMVRRYHRKNLGWQSKFQVPKNQSPEACCLHPVPSLERISLNHIKIYMVMIIMYRVDQRGQVLNDIDPAGFEFLPLFSFKQVIF